MVVTSVDDWLKENYTTRPCSTIAIFPVDTQNITLICCVLLLCFYQLHRQVVSFSVNRHNHVRYFAIPITIYNKILQCRAEQNVQKVQSQTIFTVLTISLNGKRRESVVGKLGGKTRF